MTAKGAVLPYVGGVAGYNSGYAAGTNTVATIENCYSAAAHLATGDKAGDKKNGADNAATKPAQGVFAGMGWDFSGVWRMAADG